MLSKRGYPSYEALEKQPLNDLPTNLLVSVDRNTVVRTISQKAFSNYLTVFRHHLLNWHLEVLSLHHQHFLQFVSPDSGHQLNTSAKLLRMLYLNHNWGVQFQKKLTSISLSCAVSSAIRLVRGSTCSLPSSCTPIKYCTSPCSQNAKINKKIFLFMEKYKHLPTTESHNQTEIFE